MPGKKTKANGARKQRRGNVRISNAPSYQVPPATYELACSLANPFACSACIPDGSSGTGCFSIKEVDVFSTGAAGQCVFFALQTHPSAHVYRDTGSAATTPTIAGNWAAAQQNVTINNLYAQYRPVSMAMRISWIGPTSTDQGLCLIGQVSGRVPLSSFNGASVTTASALCQMFEIWPVRNGGVIRWDPEQMDDMEAWDATTTAASAVTSTDETPYLIAIGYTLNPSTGIWNIESVVNYEGMFKSTTFMPGGLDSTSGPSEFGWFERAKSLIKDSPKIVPFIASAGQAAKTGYQLGGLWGAGAAVAGQALGFLANGLPAPGRLTKSGLPPKLLTLG